MEVVSIKLPLNPFLICPLGDIQAGTPSSDLDLLDKCVTKALAAGAMFIGMGDYVDVGSPSNRKAWKASAFYDSIYFTMDEAVKKIEDDLYKILAPTKGKWLGMLSGHHFWQYETGNTTDTNLCQRLGAKHLGDSAMVVVRFQDKNKHAASCTIFAHHGAGSGTTLGAPLNKIERVIEWAEADLYLMGHQHKRVAANVPRFYVNSKDKLVARERLVVGTGSFLKGYMQGSEMGGRKQGTYVEKGMMRPVSLGNPLIMVYPSREGLVSFDAIT